MMKYIVLVAVALMAAGCAQRAPSNPHTRDEVGLATLTQMKEVGVEDCRFQIPVGDGGPEIKQDGYLPPRVILRWRFTESTPGLDELTFDMSCETRESIQSKVLGALLEHRQPTQDELIWSGALDPETKKPTGNFMQYPVETAANIGAAYSIDEDIGDEETRTRSLHFCIASRRKSDLMLCGHSFVKQLMYPESDVTEKALQHIKEIKFVE